MERSAPSQLCWCFSKKHTRSFQTGWFSAKLRCDLSAYLRAASLCCLTAVRWGLCFLFRWLKLNIPIFDLYFPLSSEFEDICILTHRYAGWPLQSKAADLSSYQEHRAEGKVWTCIAMSTKQPSFCLAFEMCTQTSMEGGVFLILK